jgi:hypothetical protein
MKNPSGKTLGFCRFYAILGGVDVNNYGKGESIWHKPVIKFQKQHAFYM